MESNNAIVCLTRGYKEKSGYDALIERNQRIFDFINQEKKYPLVIFHEGNISKSDQQYISDYSSGQVCKFVDISECWQGGYEAMCQFQTYHIWNYCQEFDYVLRVDEDCMIIKCDKNPFDMIDEYVYLKSVYFAESHSETNANLPEKIESLTGAKREDFYNDKYPYTNVGLAKVSFWLDKPMNDLLYMIAMCPDQRKYRYGDLPVLGSLLNIFAKGKVGTLIGISYKHLSHDNVIECQ